MILLIGKGIIYARKFFLWAFIIRAVLSWFVAGGASQPLVIQVYQISGKIIEPIVAPCRKLLSNFNTGSIDFSLILAFVIVDVASKVLLMLLRMFV